VCGNRYSSGIHILEYAYTIKKGNMCFGAFVCLRICVFAHTYAKKGMCVRKYILFVHMHARIRICIYVNAMQFLFLNV